jgi:sugar transferase (PEP-CTERM system associated)
MIRIYRHFIPATTFFYMITELLILFILMKGLIYFQFNAMSRGIQAVSPRDATILSLLLVLTTAISGLAAGLYRQNLGSNFGWVITAITAASLSFGLGILVVMFFGVFWVPDQTYMAQWQIGLPLTCSVCFVVTRRAAVTAAKHGLFARRILLIGGGSRAAEIEAFASKPEKTVQIVERLRVDGMDFPIETVIEELLASRLKADGIHEVVVATDDPRGLPMELLLQWKLSGIAVTDYPTFWEREAGYISLETFDPAWFVYGDGCRRGRLGRAVKRGLDIAASVTLLVATSPLLCAFAVLTRWETPGPVLYRQLRTGRYGQPFTLFKFRSMRTDAEAATPQWAVENDPRITRIGRFMRSTRIDELPQLVNVILGHMSLIGPRPERPYFVEQLCREIPYYADRHFIRPGLTGWAQINYPYGASSADARRKLEYDFYYLKNQSILLDLYIMISTIRVILFREGSR